jgi:hypothetical protein
VNVAKLPVLFQKTFFFFRPAATQHYEANALGGAATVSCQGVANCRQFGLGEEPSRGRKRYPGIYAGSLALLGGKARAATLKDWCSGRRKALRWLPTILDGELAKRESP